MRLVVEPRIFDFFPGLHLAVAVVRGIRNTPSEALERRWRDGPPQRAVAPLRERLA